MKILPIVSYKTGQNLLVNGDSLKGYSAELGFGFGHGNLEEWFWSAWTWDYFTLPYVSLEFRWFKEKKKHEGMVPENRKLNPIMLNVGVSGGGGLTLLFLPLGISGNAGLSTDFSQLYARAGLGLNIVGLTIGSGIYYSLTKRSTPFNGAGYTYYEISYTFFIFDWRIKSEKKLQNLLFLHE